jgi:hypothetical protein
MTEVDFNRISLEFYLPCGHTLKGSFRSEATERDREPENYHIIIGYALERIGHQLESHAARHQCELVSDDNPNGLARMS